MKFSDFLNQAWNDHAAQPSQVAARMSEGLKLIENNSQIQQMAPLLSHVLGEHLGQWDDGIRALDALKGLDCFESGSESDATIRRLRVSLQLAKGDFEAAENLLQSDKVRALAVAAAALCGQEKTLEAELLFTKSIALAQKGLAPEDPANRALAVTSNNLACALEEKPTLQVAETQLMRFAAQSARKYWEIAGTWLEVERAEYRLAKIYLKSGECALALHHAQKCLELAQKNSAPALELFFGYEAVALAEKALGNEEAYLNALEKMKASFNELSEGDQTWCRASLDKMIR